MGKPFILIPPASSFSPNSEFITRRGSVDEAIPITALPLTFTSVRTYGAIGDGVSNSTSQIQSAITAVGATGGTVYFPPGTYITTSTLTVPSNVTLFGPGAVIKSSTPANGAKINITGSNVAIVRLTFDGAFTLTSGATGFNYGLIDITGTSSGSPIVNIEISNCVIRNSQQLGIRVLGAVRRVRIIDNDISHYAVGIFAEKYDNTTIYRDLTIARNYLSGAWTSATFSGAMKLKGDGGNNLTPEQVTISGNTIRDGGEMGIELYDSMKNCSISDNIIDGCNWGISLDNCSDVSISGNKVFRPSYTGIELANAITHTIVIGNTVSGYSTGTTRGVETGIISSGPTCSLNQIIGNVIRGATGRGIDVQGNDRVTIRGNQIYDSEILLQSKGSSRVTMRENDLFGPCNFHVFLDYNDNSGSDVDVSDNRFYGAAAVDNVMIYDNNLGRTVSNIRISGNDVIGATFTNLSVNLQIPDTRLPNLQIFGNSYVEGASKAVFLDKVTSFAVIPPYVPVIQRAGISTAAKSSFTFAASGVSRWARILNINYGEPIMMQVHVFTKNAAEDVKNAITATIAASPYLQDSGVTLHPSGKYNAGVIEEIIYNNPANADQEFWLKIKPTSDGGTVEVYFSDHRSGVIHSPTWVTTSPTFSANHYRAQVEIDRPKAFQTPAIFTRHFIASAARGVMSAIKGRLHIIGAGDQGGESPDRIARFDVAENDEAFGITNTGLAHIKKNVAVGGGATITRISSGIETIDFGTIDANWHVYRTIYVPGASPTGTPTVELGWSSTLPSGTSLEYARCTAADTVEIRVDNDTGSGIAVGSIAVRATVTNFA